MGISVNLKKYLPRDGKWQFFPVLKVDGKPRPEAVVIDGVAVKGTAGTFYLEWREDGKRRQQPCGSMPRAALDAWRTKVAVLNGQIELPSEEEPGSFPPNKVSVELAAKMFLEEIKASKKPRTVEAYGSDLEWFRTRLGKSTVGAVTRSDIIRLMAKGRDEGLAQASINRRVMTGLQALRNAGAHIELKKGDWPKVAETRVDVYTPEHLAAFFAACDERERLLFQIFLMTGFRAGEVSTLRWSDVDFRNSTLGVVAKPELNFIPKGYEVRAVPVPASLMGALKKRKAQSTSLLVFPTKPHPRRPNYGGDSPDAHHLEQCKAIADRAGLNCGRCVSVSGKKKCAKGPHCQEWFLHKWRHTFATSMIQSGVDIRSLQILLGHKNIATTERYLKSLPGPELRAKIEASSLAVYL